MGSGPAGLTAARQLARKGYGVKILEKAARGRRLAALGIPAYRLPNDVVDDDVTNVTAHRRRDRDRHAVDDRGRAQQEASTPCSSRRARTAPCASTSPARRRAASRAPSPSSPTSSSARTSSSAGKKVLVVGGGNVAIDAARTARRLGAADVHQASLECCEDMPAHDFEVKEAKEEGIVLHDGWGVNHFTGGGPVQSAELKVCTCVFDPEGRFAPEYDESKQQTVECDVVIVAAGMGADTESFGLETNPNRTLKADAGTCQTAVPHVFAAGDVVTGPSMITTAVGQGRRAAFMIDRYLQGEALDAGPLRRAPAGGGQEEGAGAPGRLRPARAPRERTP